MDKQELNNKLLEACTSEKIDLLHIEELLKAGAKPLGRVEDYGDNNLYDAVLHHFINLTYGGDTTDDSDFLKITELFIKYGMDISIPEVPYDGGDVINPLWSFAFYHTDTASQVLALLLDNGLDADSAGEYWCHDLTDLGFAEYKVNNKWQCEMAVEVFKRLMLIASYPHILDNDEDLKREIWYKENNYDVTRFRNWDNFEYSFEPTDGNRLNKSIVKIFEKDTKREVWKFGFEISSDTCTVTQERK
ncbi:MAG: hypothetical protein IJA19_06295 [Clostridia bacterium]|nr:hypothetical protein [Clostridia bacterium]